MTIVLREMTRAATDATADVRVADDYPTEFSAGVAQQVGAEGRLRPLPVPLRRRPRRR